MLSPDPYELHEVAPGGLASFLKARDFKGINVTIPYKQAVIPYLDSLSESALRTGAVNTIVNENGRLTGHNTDYDGFIALARLAGIDFNGADTVIFGAGGAAKAIAAASLAMGASRVRFAARRPSGPDCVPIQDTGAYKDCNILLNATPVGMYPALDGELPSPSLFPELRGVLDCVYNPLRTRLVLAAQALGIPAEGGLMMLVAQACRARELFRPDEELPSGKAEEIYGKILRSRRNIVLCGMPGSGKSTVGRILASLTGRRVVDTDEAVVLQAGMEIPEIFAREGEQGFRRRESAAIESVAPEQGLIISVGGGAVMFEENVKRLKMNGLLVMLDRRPELLEVGGGRPLSADRAALDALYLKRMPVYRKVADVIIENNGPLEDAAEIIKQYA